MAEVVLYHHVQGLTAGVRSWRVGQTEPCRVIYLHYATTM